MGEIYGEYNTGLVVEEKMRAGMLFRVYDVGLEARLSVSVTEIIKNSAATCGTYNRGVSTTINIPATSPLVPVYTHTGSRTP